MPKNKISEWSSTAASNTDVGGINIAEGCPPSNINNAIREVMAQVKDFQIGADGDGLTVASLNLTTPLSVASGGTALTTLTAENVILGNGASAPKFVAPGTTGNVLTSNGTTWTSAAAAGGGQYLGNAAVKAIGYNAQTVGENTTIPGTYNALSAGPVTVNSGFTVTVSSGAVWTIV